MKNNKPVIVNMKETPIWKQIKTSESIGRDEIEKLALINNKSKLENELKQLGIFPLARLPEERIKAFPRPNPFIEKRTPVSLDLIDGSTVPRAYLVEKDEILLYSDLLAHYIVLENIRSIGESPYTMPYRIRKKLPWETSMSSLEFRVTLKDGSTFACWYGMINDFIELPPPYCPEDIVDVKIGWNTARNEKAVLVEPDYLVCPYELEGSMDYDGGETSLFRPLSRVRKIFRRRF